MDNTKKLIDAFKLLDESITDIDKMLKQYSFILKIGGVKTARLKLEHVFKTLKEVILSSVNSKDKCLFCGAELINDEIKEEPVTKTEDDTKDLTAPVPEKEQETEVNNGV